LWNEDHDSPSDPSPYGFMGWDENDEFVLVNDKYGVVKLFVADAKKPEVLISGRTQKVVYRYLRTNREEKSINATQDLLFRAFNDVNKDAGLYLYKFESGKYVLSPVLAATAVNVGQPTKANDKM